MTMEPEAYSSFTRGGAELRSSCWAAFLAAVVAIPCLLFFVVLRHHTDSRRRPLLPRGSHGWVPIIGETLEYARPNQSLAFMQTRVRKYGEMFQSHLFGDPIIISCNPEVNQFICRHEHKLFKSSYPRSFISIMGEKNVSALEKDLHKKVRGALVSMIGSRLKNKGFIMDISNTIRETLKHWDGRVIYVQEELTKMTYVVIAKLVLGVNEHDPDCQALQKLYFDLIKGLVSIPISFPGMAYHKSMRARSKILKIIDDVISKRQACTNATSQDFMDALLILEERNHAFITREITRDGILSVLFAGHDTVSKAMTCAIKFLLDNADVVEKLKEEHMRIQDHMREDDLTWDDFKSMTFSNNVLLEILRLTNIAPGVFRDALEDVDINGFKVPKGCKIMAYFTLNHLDSNKFPNPFQFNPWRWEDKPLSEAHFMPFGEGPRLCPGNDFARLQTCIFLHHLLLNYRFKQVEKDELLYSPYIHFKKGLPIFFENVK